MDFIERFDPIAAKGRVSIVESDSFAIYATGDQTYLLVPRHAGTGVIRISFHGPRDPHASLIAKGGEDQGGIAPAWVTPRSRPRSIATFPSIGIGTSRRPPTSGWQLVKKKTASEPGDTHVTSHLEIAV